MKNLSFLVITGLTLIVVACGNKDNNSGSGRSNNTNTYNNSYASGAVLTKEGYVNTQTPIFEVDGTSYTIAQGSYQIMNTAFQLANNQGIQPVMVNNSYKYKARITGSLVNGVSNQLTQQYPNTQVNQSYLNVTQAEIYR